MSRASLIPTQDSGYGSTPAVVSAKKEQSPFTRNRVIALACSALGLIAVVGFGSRMNTDAALGNPFQQIMSAQAKQYEALQASKAAGIKMLSTMPVRPVFAPNARAQLGASEYQRCVAHDSKPSEGYNVSDSDQIRRDLVFDVSREDYPAVTAYNDSKTLLADVSCKVTPPGKFKDTELCMSRADFCDESCKMPVPANCDYTTKSFGACEPSVRSICNGITTYHHECETMQDELGHVTNEYDSLAPGVPPCRVDADAPFAKAAYAQMKYEAAYVDWVNAVNDATEVCTIGHALWVHNLGLYQAHYAKLEATTADLIQLCSGQNHTDEFDIDGAIADASLSYQRASKGPLSHANDRRRLVWWQQLCEPSIHALEELIKSLEIASPQLMCFAETCQQKKAGEQVAFEVLVNAHNKFEMAFADYRDEVVAYNDGVEQKHLALAATISSFESFHVIQEELHLGYEKDMDLFDRFDSGADNGHCGLTDCQVQAVCGAQLKSHFETFVSTDTCTPAPYSVDKICNPPPSPPPPSPAPVAVEVEKDLEVETLPEPVLPEEKAKEEKAEAEHAGEEPMPMPQGSYSVGARAW